VIRSRTALEALGSNRTITSIDETGVALLAIQGLNARHEDQAAQ
jgi:hypothetical protein